MEMIKNYFLPDLSSATPAGYLSAGHFTWSLITFFIWVGAAIFFGIRMKGKDDKKQDRVLAIATIIMLVFEGTGIILDCVRTGSLNILKGELPFYLCSIQFVNQPVACWGKGRIKKVAKNFLFIWGFITAIFGIFLDASCYGWFPLVSFEVLRNTVTHGISGFGALYLIVSGQINMKKKDILPVMAEFGIFLICALICAWTLGENYMFFLHDSGTPFRFFYAAVKGNMVLYDISVAAGMSFYALLFWGVYTLIKRAAS